MPLNCTLKYGYHGKFYVFYVIDCSPWKKVKKIYIYLTAEISTMLLHIQNHSQFSTHNLENKKWHLHAKIYVFFLPNKTGKIQMIKLTSSVLPNILIKVHKCFEKKWMYCSEGCSFPALRTFVNKQRIIQQVTVGRNLYKWQGVGQGKASKYLPFLRV